MDQLVYTSHQTQPAITINIFQYDELVELFNEDKDLFIDTGFDDPHLYIWHYMTNCKLVPLKISIEGKHALFWIVKDYSQIEFHPWVPNKYRYMSSKFIKLFISIFKGKTLT